MDVWSFCLQYHPLYEGDTGATIPMPTAEEAYRKNMGGGFVYLLDNFGNKIMVVEDGTSFRNTTIFDFSRPHADEILERLRKISENCAYWFTPEKIRLFEPQIKQEIMNRVYHPRLSAAQLDQIVSDLAAVLLLTMKVILRTEERIAALCETYVTDDASFLSMMRAFDYSSVKIFQEDTPDFSKSYIITLPPGSTAGHHRTKVFNHLAEAQLYRPVRFSDVRLEKTTEGRWTISHRHLYDLVYGRDAEPFIENPETSW